MPLLGALGTSRVRAGPKGGLEQMAGDRRTKEAKAHETNALIPAGIEEYGHQISDLGTAALRQRQTPQPRLDLYRSDFSQFVLSPVRKSPAIQVRLVSLLG